MNHGTNVLPRTLIAVLAAISLVLGMVQMAPADRAQALDGNGFDPGNIITDGIFFDSNSMDESAVQQFLQQVNPNCVGANGYPCLKDFVTATTSKAAVGGGHCAAYSGASAERASAIIVKVARACGISPKVLLVTLQKEQGLVTATSPSERQYRVAMGYGCPDTAPCEAEFYGFFNQVYRAAWQFRQYTNFPDRAYRIGSVRIAYHPNSACGSSTVSIRNQATANLYNYTPYQPNAAALANLRGVGDGCSAYGNRNFWVWFNDWFGSPTGASTMGNVDQMTIDFSTGKGRVVVDGWAFDPGNPQRSIDVHVHVRRVGGSLSIGSVRADMARPDVGAAYPYAGSAHGFSTSVQLWEAGSYQVCAYAMRSSGAVLIGCRTIEATQPQPLGSLDQVALNVNDTSGSVRIAGWGFDGLDRASARRVDIWVTLPSGARAAYSTTANLDRADVGAAYPSAGSAHGYSIDIPLTAHGRYTFCAFVIGKPYLGDNNLLLGCQPIQFGPSAPTGFVDNLELGLGGRASIGLRGWSMDAGIRSMPNAVDVWVTAPNGWRSATHVVSDQLRPDIGAAFPGAGPAHGFALDLPLSGPGTYEVCAYSIGLPVLKGGAAALRCSTVPVRASAPIGLVDSVSVISSASGRSIKVEGWTFDSSIPSITTALDVWMLHPDGHRSATHVVADVSRPDVARHYPGAGPLHGYTALMPVSQAGSYEVCAYGLGEQAVGRGVTRLGCKTIRVD